MSSISESFSGITIHSFLELAHARRTVRDYRPDPVPDWMIEKIITAAIWAPSAANSQPWHFIVVRDRTRIEQLAQVYVSEQLTRKAENEDHKGMIKDYLRMVPLVIVVAGDPRTKFKYLTTRDSRDREKLFITSVAGAIQNLFLAARVLGLGTAWDSIRVEIEDEIRTILEIPPILRLICTIPVGFPCRWPKQRPRRSIDDVIHHNTFRSEKLLTEEELKFEGFKVYEVDPRIKL